MNETLLYIGGVWRKGASGAVMPVVNPATEEQIGAICKAEVSDMDEAAASAVEGFRKWKAVPAVERAAIMHRAANLVRERSDAIIRQLTIEHGKPLAELRGEVMGTADTIDWLAEEGRRTYGYVIPARMQGVQQMVLTEPVGPVVGFVPWNFPLVQAVKKIGAALAAGCSIVLKGDPEAPSCSVDLVKAFLDAGVEPHAINLLFGDPAQMSDHLIPHPAIRKITFTGSTAVGKKLAGLAGAHMKRATMELGGHAPVIVMNDADIASAINILVAQKYRNAGQVCISPTRFMVQSGVYRDFVERFVAGAKALKVGEGLQPDTTMGPLAHAGRLRAMEELVADAVAQGATLACGGNRIGNRGFFFEPTVLTNVPESARMMNDEPFGPIAIINPFEQLEDALAEANRLPYGLAAFGYTRSLADASRMYNGMESGSISINQHILALPEHPVGGVKESGYGIEGGPSALDEFMTTKFVSLTAFQ